MSYQSCIRSKPAGISKEKKERKKENGEVVTVFKV
jgi:hypothetical protein